MARPPPPPAPKRRVWRITDAAPQGEVVDPDAPAPKSPVPERPAEGSAAGWIVSSHELRDGAEIDDRPDTVTDAQFDELFRPPPPPLAPHPSPPDDAAPSPSPRSTGLSPARKKP